MAFVKIRHILAQIKADLIGKDSHRGVTLSYAWLANQMGHFALGFIPATIIYFVLKDRVEHIGFWAMLGVSAFWLLFELYNFLGPLLTRKKAVVGYQYVTKGFQPQWFNVGFDTATDVLYFWLGTTSFGAIIGLGWWAKLPLIVVGLLLLYPSYYWYVNRIYQQKAKYPFQFRMSQWTKYISEEAFEVVRSFHASDSSNKHLVVFGGNGCGKTSLAVGLTNEQSIKKKACHYTTAIKLFGFFSDKENSKEPWSWREVEHLVVDDINPGKPFDREIITPDFFSDLFNTNPEGVEFLKNKSVIWVAGQNDFSFSSSFDRFESWKQMLDGVGVKKEDVYVVDLSD